MNRQQTYKKRCKSQVKSISYFSLFTLSLFTLILASCYADKGNYDYHEVDRVSIDTTGTGIRASYTLTRFDVLDIEPNVFFNGEKVTDESAAPLTYQWTLFSAVSGAGGSNQIDTLSNERHLVAPINRTGGNYLAQLTVTNTNDGLRQFFRVHVTVSEALDGGWMVLYERADRPGYSDLALVLNPWTKSNFTDNRCHTNLYEVTNLEPLRGKPIRCFVVAMSLMSHNYVGLCTDYTLVGVTDTGIEKAMSFENFFTEAPATMAPSWYGHHGNGGMSGQNSEVLINNNKVYTNLYYNSASADRESQFGVAKFADGMGELAAWNAELPATLNYGVIVYDQTNKCFRYTAFESARFEAFGEQNMEIAAFDVNNTGMTLVMGDWGTGASRMQAFDYLIMADGTSRKLAVANFSASSPDDEAIGVGLYDMTTLCPNIAAATSMAASNVGGYIYYAAGNTLYNFAYESGLPAEEAWTAPSGDEVITCVRIQKYYNTIYSAGMMINADNLVHIATWNEKTKQGHLYQYIINAASGDIDTTTSYDYPIPGRVKDMAWKYSVN